MQVLKKIQLGLLLLFGVFIGGLGLESAYAASTENNIGYNVSAELPKNQINKQNSFFDLKMKSGQTETLKVRVNNISNQDITIKTAIHTAWTNSVGHIDYINPTKSFDPSLRYKMSDISRIQGKKTLTIPAGKSRVVSAVVKVPKSSFNGVILGGWYFKKVDNKVTGNVKGATNIRSEYSYVIGMKYTLGKVPVAAMSLGRVAAGLSNGHQAVFANLRNTSAVIIPNLKMDTTITNRDNNQTVKHLKQSNVQTAPNSVYKYPMLFENTTLKAGNYHLHMVVKNTDRTWVFDRNFTITKAQANKYNHESVDNQGMNIWLLIALGALAMLILILLILLIIYLIRRRRRNDEDEDETK
ncbi:DUF916 and DUF3324 domain-containing protein [Levilactobacillus cerevisiae]|uniref:DUF916 and DUF3324 domain-containing protein n=1 Tax=Levilactobacillus cerevisiae TaxID=1704076 RepID=UPI000F7B280C|nr:DUF916 and DUF3324 domain-containing protein [Levilactobacillus cerevisiae]